MHAFAIGLTIAIAIAMPVWDRWEYARMKSDAANPNARSAMYLRCIVALWIVAALAVLAEGPRIFTIALAARPAWLPNQDAITGIEFGLTFGAIAMVVAMRFLPSYRAAIENQVNSGAMFPQTTRERWLFLAVSVTAGVTEEIVFRGLFLHVLFPAFPAELAIVAMLVAALAFGLAHLGQGAAGVAVTGLIGLFFCVVYVASGSLLIPIVLHTVIDARFSFVPKRAPAATV